MEKLNSAQHQRAKWLITDAVDRFGLELTDLTIFTEAASHNYIYTPIIAALAGAKMVYAVTQDSRYATAEEVIRETRIIAAQFGVADQLLIQTSREPRIIEKADIVTNLGFVRPINRWFISHMKDTAVIPLMFETWEYREQDVDLGACRKRNICVLGTNENIGGLETFKYVGNLALKLAYELNIEVFKSRVAVIGGGHFGDNVIDTFVNAGADVISFKISGRDNLITEESKRRLTHCDLLVIAEHEARDLILGENGQISIHELLEVAPHISIVHIAGNVDQEAIKKARIPCRPSVFASPGYMSVSLGYLGPKPVVDLHTAGLKVGELLARARLRGLNMQEAEKEALNNPLCQSFGNTVITQ